MSSPFCPNPALGGSSCKKRSCPVCGVRWARDWRRVFEENLRGYGRPVAMISITAPGAGQLPWDEEHCAARRVREGHRHSGKRGCRVQGRAARMWNETATWRWGAMRRAAIVYTRRHTGAPPSVLERVWEPQKRGVAHLHLIVGLGSVEELRAARVFVRKLHELAPEYGFGFVDRKLRPILAEEAARYLAGYLTGRSPHKPQLRELVVDTALAELGSRRKGLPWCWVTPRLTRQTFVTMRLLRRARHLWAAVQGFCMEGPKWTGVVEALKVGDLYRRLYLKRGPPGKANESALELGRQLDAKLTYNQRAYHAKVGVEWAIAA